MSTLDTFLLVRFSPTPLTQGSPTNTSIPAYPMLIANEGTTDLSRAAGEIGIMRNGVAMYR